MSYEPGRRCSVCGCESPRVEICGACEVDERASREADRLRSDLRAMCEAWREWLETDVGEDDDIADRLSAIADRALGEETR